MTQLSSDPSLSSYLSPAFLYLSSASSVSLGIKKPRDPEMAGLYLAR